MGKRQYSDEDKAVALAALDTHHGCVREAAAFAGVPEATLADWRDGKGVSPAVGEIRAGIKRPLADRLEDIAHELADAIPERIPKASLMQVTTSLAIAVDKMRLLRNEATSINETRDQLEEQAREILQQQGLRLVKEA